jgi:MoxR-like ATPase
MSNWKWSKSEQDQFLTEVIAKHGEVVTRRQLEEFAKSKKLPFPRFIIDSAEYKISRGTYDLKPKQPVPVAVPEPAMAVVPMVRQKKLETVVDDMIPLKDGNYVPFGFYRDMKSIIQSRIFYPVFVTGLSGNGKTTMVEQVCAELKRECVRVNVSVETDEDDLIGGNTLVDGNIVYREGPVLLAMKRGAILLIDECDRGSNKLMCLQAILEGKPYFNKKTGEVVHPAAGFNIIATANTKGRGTDDGRFIGAQILDEAFLERFAITVEQEFPGPKVEHEIIMNKMNELGVADVKFADLLVTWADIIRKTFAEGGVDEIVSTRRLIHIVKAYAMFKKNRTKAIELCINRFDEETKSAFMDLYNKVDKPEENQAVSVPENEADTQKQPSTGDLDSGNTQGYAASTNVSAGNVTNV